MQLCIKMASNLKYKRVRIVTYTYKILIVTEKLKNIPTVFTLFKLPQIEPPSMEPLMDLDP